MTIKEALNCLLQSLKAAPFKMAPVLIFLLFLFGSAYGFQNYRYFLENSTFLNPRNGIVPKIAGGEKANMDQIPYQVALMRRKKFFGVFRFEHLCGGVVIHENWILTAAHCLDE